MTKNITIDLPYLTECLVNLLNIPSPTGYTDAVVHYLGGELEKLGLPFELTRRGAIRANLKGKTKSPDRAVVAHLDTVGAMVKNFKDNGRLEIVPIGTWSSRFAEGARVTVLTENGSRRGTILPCKASGHAYNEEVDSQPVDWSNVELRIEEPVVNKQDLIDAGFNVGDYVAVDPSPEVLDSGYIISRHIDGKSGAAILLASAKAFLDAGIEPAVDSHLLFTITEEVGSGASAVLHGDVSEMVTIDMAPIASVQNTSEFGATIVMKDGSGPFDYHLTHKLIELGRKLKIPHTRDVLIHYFCDSASAIEAGNDIRTALIGFGVDASHGFERTHIKSLEAVTDLTIAYLQSSPTFTRDKEELAPLEGFPTQPD